MSLKRKVSHDAIRKAWDELKSISLVAKRTSRSYTATAQRFVRLGLVNTATGRTR
jgi:hypothetical protein